MPNTPGQIGEGITVWTSSKEVTEEQQETARAILGAMGDEVFVEDESYLDMATALSGSGPAYVFLFTEALIDAGEVRDVVFFLGHEGGEPVREGLRALPAHHRRRG